MFVNKRKTHWAKVGFLLSYFVFTTILYFILLLTHKLPESWNYVYVMAITFVLVMLGLLVQRSLR